VGCEWCALIRRRKKWNQIITIFQSKLKKKKKDTNGGVCACVRGDRSRNTQEGKEKDDRLSFHFKEKKKNQLLDCSELILLKAKKKYMYRIPEL
jgi:hypothetical protein